MDYILMHKDTPVTDIVLDSGGYMPKHSQKFLNKDLAPMRERRREDWISSWWEKRAVPKNQGDIKYVLDERGYNALVDYALTEYLLDNLGLSLTDCYWVKPQDSDLTWSDVNCFDNDFDDNLIEDKPKSDMLSPNASLQGQIEKNWITMGDKRYLVKGNRYISCAESINEVIASKIHEMQGHPHVTYSLCHIDNKDYDHGCYCPAFTDQTHEAIIAYDIITYVCQLPFTYFYDELINAGDVLGYDKDKLRADLEYQIMTDFIISNRDRHMGNISLLRNPDTLEYYGMAPIYDSGKSMFVGKYDIPKDNETLLKQRVNSFAETEVGLLAYVTDRNLVDTSKLPDRNYIISMYAENDSTMNMERIIQIADAYERKISLLRDFQLGKIVLN